MQKLADAIRLMAKTGLFFANADGHYSDEEKKYITDFVLNLELIGDVDSELKAQVMDSVNHAYSLDEIVAETQALLSGFSLEEQKAIRQSMEAFVNDIIMADGNRCSAEQENYSKWKEAIG